MSVSDNLRRVIQILWVITDLNSGVEIVGIDDENETENETENENQSEIEIETDES
jgi:hypothetical protein